MDRLDRRTFLKQTSLTAGTALLSTSISAGILTMPGISDASEYKVIEGYSMDPALIHEPKNIKKMSEFEKLHVPTLKMPLIAEDGSVVPFYVLSDHPMEDDHYIESVEILNFNDPIVHKGKINFTPANGTIYFSAQFRAVSGTNTIMGIMKCSRHGRWVGKSTVKVTVGGC